MKIAPTTKFELGEVSDKSGFTASSEDIKPAEAMKNALASAMEKKALVGTDYKIDTIVLAYSPGNAFSRWLLPGMGATHLETISRIYGPDGVTVAKIPVKRTIAAGGGFTIGAWREVFNEVAEEIVKVIQEQMLGLKKKPVDAPKDDTLK